MAHQHAVQPLGYHRSLNGLRCLAVVSVLVHHATIIPGGYLGVDIFFVLSGFLITTLLLEEWQARHAINLPYFYLRRSARLLPALLLLMFTYLVLLWLAQGRFPYTVANAAPELLYAASYMMNWGAAFHQLQAPFLPHTWSLAVEEQFYLVWPLVLIGLLRFVPRRLLGVMLLVGASAVWYYSVLLLLHGFPPGRLYFGSDTRANELLLGAAAAAFRWNGRHLRFVSVWLPSLLVGSIAAMVATTGPYDGPPSLIICPAVAVLTAWLILVLVGPPVSRMQMMLGARPLVWLGQRAYGIYLWHNPLMRALQLAAVPPPLVFVLGGALSIVIAACSFKYLEQPFVRMARRRLATRAAQPTGVVTTQ